MFLDYVIMCFILVPPLILFNVFANGSSQYDEMAPYIQMLMILMLVPYFFKDSFNGRSLAKRMLKLQVVDNTTGEVASVGKCFVRNIFIIIWPVEVLVSLFSPQRRIGDMVAGTKVVNYTTSQIDIL